MISSVFGTGTGRCGSLLLANIINCSRVIHCNHEHSVNVKAMKNAYLKQKMEVLIKDSHNILVPTVRQYNDGGKVYGEINCHLYFLFPELFRRYEYVSRFILLTRKPDTFIRSALARGFFSPKHPHALEHLVPPKDTEMGYRWKESTPFEKCAWYWGLVNGVVYRFFKSIPESMYRIVPLESLDIVMVEDIYSFIGLPDFEELRPKLEELLAKRHNASPGQDSTENTNPFSKQISLGPMNTWTESQISTYHKHVTPMFEVLYGKGQ